MDRQIRSVRIRWKCWCVDQDICKISLIRLILFSVGVDEIVVTSKFVEVHLDLVSCPSARSRRDRESPFEIEMRRDHLTSETAEISLEIVGRDQGFYSRSWVEMSRSGQYDVTTYVRYVYRCMYRDTTAYISVRMYVHVRSPSRISREQGCRDRDVCSIEISRISSPGARSSN